MKEANMNKGKGPQKWLKKQKRFSKKGLMDKSKERRWNFEREDKRKNGGKMNRKKRRIFKMGRLGGNKRGKTSKIAFWGFPPRNNKNKTTKKQKNLIDLVSKCQKSQSDQKHLRGVLRVVSLGRESQKSFSQLPNPVLHWGKQAETRFWGMQETALGHSLWRPENTFRAP